LAEVSGRDGQLAKSYILRRRQWVPRPVDVVFDFFSRPSNLQSITPAFLDFKITDAPAELQAGSLVRYTLRIHRVPVCWTTEITEWKPPHSFVDVQVSGPYRLWRHTHTLPLAVIGRVAHWVLVRRDLEVIFDYRGEKMRELFGGEF
jgi:hypothetical protein